MPYLQCLTNGGGLDGPIVPADRRAIVRASAGQCIANAANCRTESVAPRAALTDLGVHQRGGGESYAAGIFGIR